MRKLLPMKLIPELVPEQQPQPLGTEQYWAYAYVRKSCRLSLGQMSMSSKSPIFLPLLSENRRSLRQITQNTKDLFTMLKPGSLGKELKDLKQTTQRKSKAQAHEAQGKNSVHEGILKQLFCMSLRNLVL